MNFTVTKYKELLSAIIENDYAFQTFSDFIESPKDRVVILRHDVDLLPQNSQNFAIIQNELGIQGTYYFRAVPESWDENIIKEISNLGHEIGYHYESLTTCNGDLNKALIDFEENLKELRKISSVNTICMHGSPKSKFDSKDLWLENDYKQFGLTGEPYFDVDFDTVYYLTDTGRMWDGEKYSVRDKVNSSIRNNYHSTDQIIRALEKDKLPKQIMFTFHPQRWHSNNFLWIKELLMQNIKNIVKKYMYVQN